MQAEFTKQQLNLLLNGLVSLEGSMGALQQSVPAEIVGLKDALVKMSELPIGEKSILTTEEVALILKLKERRIQQLGSAGIIRVVEKGRRGRGRSTLYDARSVEDYLASKKIQSL